MPHAFFHADGNGNVTCLIGPHGQVLARYLYDPFGNELAAVGPLANLNLYRFSSKELHPPSGLVYYGYRFYEPSLQRWLSRDPVGETGFRTLIRSRRQPLATAQDQFAFVRNRPTVAVDSFGLDWRTFKCVCAILGLQADLALTGIACGLCLIGGEGGGVGDVLQCIGCLGGLASLPVVVDEVRKLCEDQPIS